MAKSKDPAFLFYSKDWIEGTAELLPAEKGIYIDLLAHQHQKGSLPQEPERLSRIVALTIEEFKPLWAVVSKKFIPVEDGRIANRRLMEVTGERSDRANKNKVIGMFGYLIKQSGLSDLSKQKIRSQFNCDEFIAILSEHGSERCSERLTEWYQECLAVLEDANGNEDVLNKGKAKFTLEYFNSIGFDFGIKDEEFKEAVSKFLIYRINKNEPIKTYEQVEAIIKNLRARCKTTEEAIKVFDHTIEKGAKNLIYDVLTQTNKTEVDQHGGRGWTPKYLRK